MQNSAPIVPRRSRPGSSSEYALGVARRYIRGASIDDARLVRAVEVPARNFAPIGVGILVGMAIVIGVAAVLHALLGVGDIIPL